MMLCGTKGGSCCWWARIVVLATLLVFASAKCPNLCSGHGVCGPNNACSCDSGWTGGAADCSYRSCPQGVAWVDRAYAKDTAHDPAECSNMGICDRATGTCKCFPGFTGIACQRAACPNGCSGHGLCSTMSDVSRYRGLDYDPTLASFGDGFGVVYSNWEKDSMQLCDCEPGYFGPDCSQKMCPKDDDPFSINQNYRAIGFRLSSDHLLAGSLGLQFMGTTVYLPLINYTNQNCSEYISWSEVYGQVECTSTYVTYRQRLFTLEFKSWPLISKENNLYSHTGNPSLQDFRCSTARMTRLSTCHFWDIQSENIREYVYCSNRGVCDYATGLCKCKSGYSGPACSNSSYSYDKGFSPLPGRAVNMNANNFSSTAVHIATSKSPAPDFLLIDAVAGGDRMFYVRGDGVVGITSLLSLTGGYTIGGGGLYVEKGGMTVASIGMSVSTETSEGATAYISSTSASATSTHSVLQFNSTSPFAHNNFFIMGASRGTERLRVRADGNMYVRRGGMHVSRGLTVATSGLQVTSGLSVQSGGLSVQALGLVASGGFTVHQGGVAVSNSGLKVSGGVSLHSAGFKVVAGTSVFTAGMSCTGGITVNTRGVYAPSGLTVEAGGVSVTSGTTVATQGVVVDKNGVTVSQNGLVVTGGARLNGGPGRTIGGVTVTTNGLRINGGLTVFSGGLEVVNTGLSIGTTLAMTGRLSVTSGMVVVGGMTLSGTAGGSIVGGLTCAAMRLANGAVIDGGLTATSSMLVTDGLRTDTLQSSGQIDVTGSAEFDSLVVTTGMTVYQASHLESSPIYFSDRRLKTNLAPITDALEKVSKIKGVYFNWVDEEVSGMKMDRARHVGVLAQDVLRVLPEVVEDKHDKYLSVDYPAMVPLLIEAIRDLESLVVNMTAEKSGESPSEELESLERVVQDIREKNAQLRVRLGELRAIVDLAKQRTAM